MTSRFVGEDACNGLDLAAGQPRPTDATSLEHSKGRLLSPWQPDQADESLFLGALRLSLVLL